MKRIVAFALALLLLASMFAWAEESASTLLLSELSVSRIAKKTRTARLGDITVFLALGSPDGAPTLQATFDNGDGQVFDAVAQLSGSELRLAMGGISGVFTLDLSRVAPDGNGDMLALGLSGGMAMAGANLEGMLRAMTRDEGKGNRSAEFTFSTQPMADALEGLLALTEGSEAAQGMDVDAVRRQIEAMQGEATLKFGYNEDSGAFKLAIVQNGVTRQLAGVMALNREPMTFIDLSTEEGWYDLMDMDPAVLEQVKGEMNLVGIKFMHFADGSGLDNML